MLAGCNALTFMDRTLLSMAAGPSLEGNVLAATASDMQVPATSSTLVFFRDPMFRLRLSHPDALNPLSGVTVANSHLK